MFDADGNLRPLSTIHREVTALDARGFDVRRQIVAYCTRGVRASFAVATLTAAGFNVTLYEGTGTRLPEPD